MLRSSLHKKGDNQHLPKLAHVSWHTSVTIINDEKGPAQRSYLWRSETSSTSSEATCSPPVKTRRPLFPLHRLVSPDSHTLVDIRLDPSIYQPLPGFFEPATITMSRVLRVISRDFPWTLEVRSQSDGPVTCGDVFFAMHTSLSLPLTNSEWTLADEKKKDSIMRANRHRRGGSVRKLRRIDWLGSKVYFKGLNKDDSLGRARLLPEDEFWPDTWVAKFSSH